MPLAFCLALLLLLTAGAPFAQGVAPLTRIAFGSCADEEKPQPIWDAVLRYRPDLFLFAGDNVYGDVRNGRSVPEGELIVSLQQAYAQAARLPGLVALRSTVPHLATWDDHDYGKNDAGADFAARYDAQKLFLQFWDVPLADERHRREGIYHARTFGPQGQRVQVILLDTRFFRSPLRITDQRNAPGRERYMPDDDPAKTMLGDAQWAWLADRLREPAEVRVVVSSVQVLAEGHGWERWGNFPRERQRLYDLIRDTGANGVVFLSGDRHIGGLYRESAGTPYPLVEITSSGINQEFAANREPGPNRLGAVYGAPNFGAVEIDWWEGILTLSLRNGAGEAVRRHTVRMDDLAAQRR
jgi:alkaline phosphatase D